MRSVLSTVVAAAVIAAPLVLHADAARTRVMVTGFQAFDGREVNNSWRIAQALGEAAGSDFDIVTCELPVVYDRGAEVARGCFEKMEQKPDLVISMGEAGCDIRLETAAHNKDHTPGFPDNEGNIRSDKAIEEGGPPSIGFNLPVQAMYCALPPEDREKVDISETPGGYVCNNTAFLLSRFFQQLDIPFAFVHVPAAAYCGEGGDPKKNAAVLAQMLRGAVAHDRSEVSTTYPLPHCTNEELLPVDADAVQRISDSLDEAADKDCAREFLDRLRRRLP